MSRTMCIDSQQWCRAAGSIIYVHILILKGKLQLLKPSPLIKAKAAELKHHIAPTMTIEAPFRIKSIPSEEKFQMRTSQGYSIQFYIVPPRQVELSQQFCPTCCRLYRNNVGFRGSHQPIRLVCGHTYCLGCVLTRVDSIRDRLSACDKCHPDTNKSRSSSQES